MKYTLIAFLFVAACGSGANDAADLGPSLDGHLQSGCDVDDDCDDGQKCHESHCIAGVCQHRDVVCPGGDACNAATCRASVRR